LGARNMSFSDFLAGLKKMDRKDKIRDQLDSWHQTVSMHLDRFCVRGIKHLRIIPLKSGSWVNGQYAERYVFDSGLSSFPPGLDLESVVDVDDSRYSILYKLGVRPANATLIAQKILGLRGNHPVQMKVQQTRFLFKHRHLISSSVNYEELKVIDTHGREGYGHEVYVDVSESGRKFGLHDILPNSARFLHREYYGNHGGVESEWIYWLCKSVGLNAAPRVVRGLLSPEFKQMVQELDTQEMLLVLKQYWTHIGWRLSETGKRELSETEVECQDGDVLPLKDTFLKTKILAGYPLHAVLPVDNPNDESWGFLHTLGVSAELDPPFLVKLLSTWQEEDEMDVPVERVYKQLEARFEQDEVFIL
jgi:hypothetical protein